MTGHGPREWPTLPRPALVSLVVTRLSAEHSSGVILSGESGAGKSTIADAAAREFSTAAAPRETIRLRGTELSSAVPYGLLYGLLQDSDAAVFDSAAAVFRALGSVIAERSNGLPRTILVDNAHLVDELSAHALAQLATSGRTSLVIVAPDLGELPDSLLELWRDGLLTEVGIPALTPDEITRLLTLHLDGPIAQSALTLLAESSGGNPLFLNYLVAEQFDSRVLVTHEGVWVLSTRASITSERLLGLLRTRLDRWSDAEREVLEIVALTDSIDFSHLERVVDAELVSTLLESGVIEIQPGTQPAVRIRHRLVSEVIRAGVPFVRRRQLLARVSPFYSGLLEGSAESILAFSAWMLECGVPLEPELALRSAILANQLFDPEFALRTATSVPVGPLFLAAALEKSRAWRILGLPANASSILHRFDGDALATLSAADTARYAIEFTAVARLIPAERDAAAALLVGASDRLLARSETERSDREMQRGLERGLECATWTLLVARGEYSAVLAPLEAAYSDRSDRYHWLAAASLYAETLAVTGLHVEAVRIAAEIDPLLADAALSDDLRELAQTALFNTYLRTGLWNHNIARLTAGSLEQSGHHLYSGGASESAIGISYLFGGRAREGHGHLLSALGQVRVRDVYNSRGQILAGLALSSALRGETENANLYLAELGTGLPSSWHTVASAHYLALSAVALIGDAGEATTTMLGLAAEYRTHGLLSDELFLVAAAARSGSREALDLLQVRSLPSPGPMANAVYDWATAVKSGDASLLVASAGVLQLHGNDLFAREAASRVLELTGGEHAITASGIVRASSATLGQTDAAAPALIGLESLTRRERDVTLLAAEGQANREIAAALHLSVRTVESYLQTAFGKLGVGGRSELATLLR